MKREPVNIAIIASILLTTLAPFLHQPLLST